MNFSKDAHSSHSNGSEPRRNTTTQARPQVLVTPADLAERFGLKRHSVKGLTEWHGPNPSGQGAQDDGFWIRENGTAHDRNGTSYSTRETAELCGIEPEQYAPEVEYREHNGHANGPTAPRQKVSSTAKPKAPAKLPKAPFSWERAQPSNYRDGGVILYQVGRCYAPGCEKSIRQRRPVDPECREEENAGGWVHNLDAGFYEQRGADFYLISLKPGQEPPPGARHFPEVPRVLYRRADVLSAETVYVCEGEKAADALNHALMSAGMSAGLYGPHVATTNPHGGGTWTGERGESYSADLAGKRVIVQPDNDAKGEQHAATACASIYPHAARLQVLRLPNLPDKGDVADFLDAGGTVEELLELAEAAPDWAPTEAPGQAEDDAQFISTQDATPRRRITILTAAQLKARPVPSALIRDVLMENTIAEICGAAASYKSFQGIAMAEAIAGGHEWHGRATKQTPVVYITGEGAGGLSQRIEALENRHQRPCEAMFIPEAVQLHRPDEAEALLWAIGQLPQEPGLIVVDTLARCFVGGDENSAKDAGLFVAGVDRIRSASGAAVLILHHLNKAGESRGSTAFSGAMDTIVEARRENTTVTLRCLKQKDAPEFEPLTLVRRVVELDGQDEYGRPLTSLTFEPTDAPPTVATPSKSEQTRQQVLEVLRQEFPSGAKVSKWAAACKKKGVPNGSFYEARTALINCGQVAEPEEDAIYRPI